ncbi:MAG TPA: prephenate dehydratase domain-containing protein [Polyangiaceae bacterium]|nr:prephenate dehydratase domain-containing protein [Polyangiaceae bacterium]
MAGETAPVERIYTLGPEGTFSERAAERVRAHVARAGAPAALVYTPTIAEALARAAADPRSLAVAPIENSDSGTVIATQDRLAQEPLLIEWQVDVRIRYALLARGPVAGVRALYAHSLAHAQCDLYLAEHLPEVDVAFTRSNAESGQRLLADEAPGRAALVPLEYAARHAELVRAEDVQNAADNCTRFVAARALASARPPDFSRPRASVAVEPAANRPGVLFEILGEFARAAINLRRVEARPARTGPWTYVFYLDIECNGAAEGALEAVRALGHGVKLLGTYEVLT